MFSVLLYNNSDLWWQKYVYISINENIARHTAHTIVSRYNRKQLRMIDISDLVMITR